MNGTYIFLWLQEVRRQLAGRCIDDIRIRERLVQIVLGRQSLYISLYPEVLAICLNRKDERGYESLTAFSTPVRGMSIAYLEQDSFKPVLRMGLQTGTGRDSDGIVLNVLLYREAPNLMIAMSGAYRKLFPRIVDKKARQPLWALSDPEVTDLFSGERERAAKRILAAYEGMDQNLVKELTPGRVMRLRDIIHGGESPRPRLVSVKPLRISLFAGDDGTEYPSFNALLQDVIDGHSAMRRREQAAAERKKALRTLERRIGRLKKKLLAPEEIERYRLIGNCLLANLAKIKKGDEHIALPVLPGQGACEILLDPAKSPQENAQMYFARYKRAKRGQPQLQEKIRHLEKERVRTQSDAWAPIEKPAGQREKTAQRPGPFRMFRLSGSACVYVGKNARSNDELTFSFARPHDYFFHVRGYQGSHVILRVTIKRGQHVSKKDIETAAAIAAYYSKAKTQKRVPVSYTQRKYLKKAKRGAPGTVILMREEVIFVDPGIPEQGGN